jgi:hypothetical protein
LPRFRVRFFVLLIVLLIGVGIVVEVLLVVFKIVVLVVEIEMSCKDDRRNRGVRHEAGSAAGLALSRLGGGYVDQKCRPQRGHTQNWSGIHGVPGAGSRNSISAPQR